MQLSRLLFLTAFLVAPVALVGTTWLYFYPFFDRACSFPTRPDGSLADFRLLAFGDPQLEGDSSLPKPGAPIFRSLENLAEDVRNAGSWSRGLHFVREGISGVPKDILRYLEGHRKRIDLWGNDYYLGHIVRTLRWWTDPSHVAVLGDLLGSQWIKDEEFERRVRRYWDIVFRGMEKVPESIMTGYDDIEEQGVAEVEGESESESETQREERKKRWGGSLEKLGADRDWKNRVINIAGNHDIGYAGDIDENRIERFENAFGKVNWDIAFELPQNIHGSTPHLRLVILNSMNLDTPAYVESLQRETYDFMNHIISTSKSVEDKTHSTVLLTHIPFYKEAGICVDAPYFNFFEGGSGVKEQNMLSDYASKIMLEGIFGLNSDHEAAGQGFGRHGIVINGHDHEGCDVMHYITQPGSENKCPEDIDMKDIHMSAIVNNASVIQSEGSSVTEPDSASEIASANETASEAASDTDSSATESSDSGPQPPAWQAIRFPYLPYKHTEDGECIALKHVPQIREITLRSMMGAFSGYTGFLSAWFDYDLGDGGEWRMEFNTCGMGVQHWWWGVHIIDLILVVAVFGGVVAKIVESSAGQTAVTKPEKGGKK